MGNVFVACFALGYIQDVTYEQSPQLCARRRSHCSFWSRRHTDVLERDDKLLAKNVEMNKVSVLEQELGQQPILAFGNSSGDASMMTYTIANNIYKSMAFWVVNDDMQREYGDPAKSAKMKATASQQDWTVISMQDDFKTIYGENVTKAIN